jgi:hypothetical protein
MIVNKTLLIMEIVYIILVSYIILYIGIYIGRI